MGDVGGVSWVIVVAEKLITILPHFGPYLPHTYTQTIENPQVENLDDGWPVGINSECTITLYRKNKWALSSHWTSFDESLGTGRGWFLPVVLLLLHFRVVSTAPWLIFSNNFRHVLLWHGMLRYDTLNVDQSKTAAQTLQRPMTCPNLKIKCSESNFN